MPNYLENMAYVTAIVAVNGEDGESDRTEHRLGYGKYVTISGLNDRPMTGWLFHELESTIVVFCEDPDTTSEDQEPFCAQAELDQPWDDDGNIEWLSFEGERITGFDGWWRAN